MNFDNEIVPNFQLLSSAYQKFNTSSKNLIWLLLIFQISHFIDIATAVYKFRHDDTRLCKTNTFSYYSNYCINYLQHINLYYLKQDILLNFLLKNRA